MTTERGNMVAEGDEWDQTKSARSVCSGLPALS